ncbi:site-specific integrase, partial [Streptomyces niveiscabiei]
TANPGIDTIALTAEQATTWKQWLMVRPDGTERRDADSTLSAVRSFYLDLAAWAHEEPGRWAEWAVPCPISVRDVRGSGKR